MAKPGRTGSGLSSVRVVVGVSVTALPTVLGSWDSKFCWNFVVVEFTPNDSGTSCVLHSGTRVLISKTSIKRALTLRYETPTQLSHADDISSRFQWKSISGNFRQLVSYPVYLWSLEVPGSLQIDIPSFPLDTAPRA